jgi:hypothetical protein
MPKRLVHDARTGMGTGLISNVYKWLEANNLKSQKVEVWETNNKTISSFKVLLDKEGFPNFLNVDKVYITIKIRNKAKIEIIT